VIATRVSTPVLCHKFKNLMISFFFSANMVKQPQTLNLNQKPINLQKCQKYKVKEVKQ